MRIITKGGVWKNSEDEILKAAVMKYGITQWDRVASLLNRKSAKQCKERWKNWLDPSIKKTEWSRDEEERLLHLAKIMPNQWRTIAPIVGRTPAQCLEHYDKLLERVQHGDEEEEKNLNDPKRLRQGEQDPNPETRPAKPDAIDMDEDEKEMLSEARARLANTKGKKAKRKAREKQLEEARRLASLQKRREMRAAGIELPQKKKKQKGIDVIAEIPFQRRAPTGFYEQEPAQAPDKANFKTLNVKDIEGKSRKEREQERKELAQQKEKERAKKNLPALLLKTSSSSLDSSTSKRSKLVLSAPVVTDEDMRTFAKQKETGGLNSGDALGQTPLLRTPMRTPKSARDDELMRQAENLAMLKNAQTPLLGGENPVLHPSDFSSATPKPRAIQTPNVIASSTGAASATPMATKTGTGVSPHIFAEKEGASLVSRGASVKEQLRQALSRLPAPQNEIVTALPEDFQEEEEQDPMQTENAGEEGEAQEEDASDRIRNRQREAEQLKQQKLARRSQVLQRGLPRPTLLPKVDTSNHPDPYVRQAQDLLAEEMSKLIRYESALYPFADCAIFSDMTEDSLTFPSQERMAESRQLIEDEIGRLQTERGVTDQMVMKAQESVLKNRIFNPITKAFQPLSKTNKKDQVAFLETEFQFLAQTMAQQTKRATKLEKRIVTYHTGFRNRSENLAKQISILGDELGELELEYEAYDELRVIENRDVPERIAKLTQEVEDQLNKNNHFQERYKELTLNN